MPDRLIRDEILTSERYWSVTIEAQRLYFHLLLVADDTARFSGNNYTIRASCFPGQSIEPAKLESLLLELQDRDLIRVYAVDNSRYLFIPKFRQRVRYPRSKYPPPPIEISDIPEEKTGLRPTQARLKTDPSQAQVVEVKRSEEKRREVKDVSNSIESVLSLARVKTGFNNSNAKSENHFALPISEKARAKGIELRNGETWEAFKQRVEEA